MIEEKGLDSGWGQNSTLGSEDALAVVSQVAVRVDVACKHSASDANTQISASGILPLIDGDDLPPIAQRRCGNEPKPSTQWQGENINRFCDEEYDTLLDELSRTSKIEERAVLVKRLNDIITTESKSMLPLINRTAVAAQGNTLGGVKLNAWDSDLWNVADWYRTEVLNTAGRWLSMGPPLKSIRFFFRRSENAA